MPATSDVDYNFTLDEIREQLATLGLTGVSRCELRQIKRQLDELITRERRQELRAPPLNMCVASSESSNDDKVVESPDALGSGCSDSLSETEHMWRLSQPIKSTINNAHNSGHSTGDSTLLSCVGDGVGHTTPKPIRHLAHIRQTNVPDDDSDWSSGGSELADVTLSSSTDGSFAASSVPGCGEEEASGLLDAKPKPNRRTLRIGNVSTNDRPSSKSKRLTARSPRVIRYPPVSARDGIDPAHSESARLSIGTHQLTSVPAAEPFGQVSERAPVCLNSDTNRTRHFKFNLPLGHKLKASEHALVMDVPPCTHRHSSTPKSMSAQPTFIPPSVRSTTTTGRRHRHSRNIVPSHHSRSVSSSSSSNTSTHIRARSTSRLRHSKPRVRSCSCSTTSRGSSANGSPLVRRPTQDHGSRRLHSARFATDPVARIHESSSPPASDSRSSCVSTSVPLHSRRSGSALTHRHDPVTRYRIYRESWRKHSAPGEDARRVLRWNVKTAMMHRELPLLQRNFAEVSMLLGPKAVAYVKQARQRTLNALQQPRSAAMSYRPRASERGPFVTQISHPSGRSRTPYYSNRA